VSVLDIDAEYQISDTSWTLYLHWF